jgi:hypothetical protein
VSRKLLIEEATQPRTKRNRIRILLWLLVLLMLITIATLVTLITLQPNLVGLMPIADFSRTNSAVQSTAIALQATDQINLQRGLDLQNTEAALGNFASRLAQTETQQVINGNTTSTAIALANAAQATQAAQDFQGTQSALRQESTRIQQQFEATQTALAQRFATIEANRPAENVTLLNGNFVRGVESAEQITPSIAWGTSDTGTLIAQADNATALLRPATTPPNYTINARITPKREAANYDVLLGVIEGGGGYTLRLYHNGTQLTGAALLPINSAEFINPNGLPVDDSTAVAVIRDLTLTASELAVEILVNGTEVRATVNGLTLFTTQIPDLSAGMIGVQLREESQLQTLLFIPRS